MSEGVTRRVKSVNDAAVDKSVRHAVYLHRHALPLHLVELKDGFWRLTFWHVELTTSLRVSRIVPVDGSSLLKPRWFSLLDTSGLGKRFWLWFCICREGIDGPCAELPTRREILDG